MSSPAGSGRDGGAWQRVEDNVAAIVADARWRIDRSAGSLAVGDVHALDVHALRVACKRLRAMWRMLEPGLGVAATRPAERMLGDAAKSLAGQRQAVVLVQTLTRLAHKVEKSKDRELAVDLAGRLIAALGVPEAVVRLQRPQSRVLRAAFDGQEPALAALPRPPSSEDLLLGILSGVERARRFGRRADRGLDARLWHRCRRWVKYEHYQLELALRPKRRLRLRQHRLERLGVLLGRHQDDFDLEQQLAASSAALTLPEPAMVTLFAWRQQRDAERLLTCVRRQQRRLLARVEQRFDVLYGDRCEQLEGWLRSALARA